MKVLTDLAPDAEQWFSKFDKEVYAQYAIAEAGMQTNGNVSNNMAEQTNSVYNAIRELSIVRIMQSIADDVSKKLVLTREKHEKASALVSPPYLTSYYQGIFAQQKEIARDESLQPRWTNKPTHAEARIGLTLDNKADISFVDGENPCSRCIIKRQTGAECAHMMAVHMLPGGLLRSSARVQDFFSQTYPTFAQRSVHREAFADAAVYVPDLELIGVVEPKAKQDDGEDDEDSDSDNTSGGDDETDHDDAPLLPWLMTKKKLGRPKKNRHDGSTNSPAKKAKKLPMQTITSDTTFDEMFDGILYQQTVEDLRAEKRRHAATESSFSAGVLGGAAASSPRRYFQRMRLLKR